MNDTIAGIILIFFLGLVSHAFGTILEVPPYTIQEAIEATSTGDTILIHDGIYEGALSIQNKDLTLLGCQSTTISGKLAVNGSNIYIQHVDFTNSIHQPMPGIQAQYSEVTIQNCRFYNLYGTMELAIHLYFCTGELSGNIFENLFFEPFGTGYESGGAVTLYHSPVFVSNNIFRNSTFFDEAALNIINYPYESRTVHGNRFENLVNTGDGPAGILIIGCRSVITSNTFQNCHGGGAGAVGASFYGEGMSTPGFCFTIAQNAFYDNSARPGYNEVASAILAVGQRGFYGHINYNCFTGNTGQTIAHTEIDSQYTWIAENNWWGDSSGPYHPELNLEGRGDTVGDRIDFEPWEGQSDVSKLVEGKSETEVIFYPNPTRDHMVIEIIPAQSGQLEMRLYNILGQLVDSVDGVTCRAGELLTLDWVAEENLPAGIYFMRLYIGEEVHILKFMLHR